MDSRTRVQNVLAGRPVDRIPMHDAFWEDTLALWRSLEFLDHFTKDKDHRARLSERLVLNPDGLFLADDFGYTRGLLPEYGEYIYHSDHSVPPEVSFQRYGEIMQWVQSYGACSHRTLGRENHDS